MYYIFREQPSCGLRCVSKRKTWVKGQRTEALIKILQGWGTHSVFHIVKASSIKDAISIVRNHQIPQSIEKDIELQWIGEYIETIIIDIDSENENNN